MVEGRRGLGRGLSALLDEAQAASTPEGRAAAGTLDLPIELVRRNPDQPRRAFAPTTLTNWRPPSANAALFSPSWCGRLWTSPVSIRSSPASGAGARRRWRGYGQSRLWCATLTN